MISSLTNWKLKEETEKHLGQVNMDDFSPIVQKLLLQRGITDELQAQSFLHPDIADLHAPTLLTDMAKAGERVHQAIENNEKILIFGDYDADGVSSTTLMMNALTELGANCSFYIPNRFTEGYGPNETAFRQADDSGFQLIITVDTGIAAVDEAAVAKELGLDLIITDHHEVQEQMPDAFAIIHPKYAPEYPFKELAGVGVAFKFAQHLLGYFPTHLLDLVAIGTIADLVPLTDENRILAFHGLRQLSVTKRQGIVALKKCCGLQGEITEEHVGFQIGPHLNAVGRLQDADLAVDLLMTTDQEEAEELASMVQSLNKERKKIVAEIADEAKNMLLHTTDEDGVIVVAQKGWNEGVLGIVASRLVREFDRPAIVLSINEVTGKAKGSARSIPAFDLFQGCMKVNHLFMNFGGHAQAAGMTLPLENVEKLRTELNCIIRTELTPEDFKQEVVIDASLKPEDVTVDLIQEVDRLAPFGMKNNKPVFHLSGMPYGIRKLGNGNKHLKMQFKYDGGSVDGIGFGLGELADFITPDANVSVVGQLSVNEWNGNRKPQMVMQDLCIDDWQLFDHRGRKTLDMSVYLQKSPYPAIIGHTNQLDASNGYPVQKSTYVRAASELGKVTDLFLFDLPDDLPQLENILQQTRPVNVHACFYVQNSSYLTVFPDRNAFKKLYAYIYKYKTLHSKMDMGMLAAVTGLNQSNIKFMLRVFLELDFIQLENGVVTLHANPNKKDLTMSSLYQQRKNQMIVEKTLYYSTYEDLRKWFEQILRTEEKAKEEVAYGL